MLFRLLILSPLFLFIFPYILLFFLLLYKFLVFQFVESCNFMRGHWESSFRQLNQCVSSFSCRVFWESRSV
ncbi:hypothetical protein EB796_021956 [Bugula neritina]|uniref:Uncharacterized protein n=1 Tax=Bugula neritina TaxID=10212 RepID=A0A7J7J2Q2_BUGNE|nr:hypothetical protein EB796_021956 [Bugula neritina]